MQLSYRVCYDVRVRGNNEPWRDYLTLQVTALYRYKHAVTRSHGADELITFLQHLVCNVLLLLKHIDAASGLVTDTLMRHINNILNLSRSE